MSLIFILNVGQDPILLESRSSILRAAGYMVESILSVKQAVRQFEAGDFDLVLMCHSIPQKERDQMTCLIKASGSLTPIICVGRADEQFEDVFVDATIDGTPKELLIGVNGILNKALRRLSTANTKSPNYGDGQTRRKTILCVDDEPNILSMRRRTLENAGYQVLTASGGSDGIKVFSSGAVDAVILDYAMPNMNGGAVAALMRQINKDVPLLLISGCASIPREDLKHFNRYIPKGMSPKILLTTLEEMFSDGNEHKETAPSRRSQSNSVSHAIQ